MLPRTRISPELIDHWPVIAVSATCLFFTFGMPAASLPFLYKSVIEEFHWTREQATMLGSLHWLSGAFVSLFIGRFVERIGALRVVLATAILSGLSMVSFRFTNSIVDYYLAGIGLGLSGFGMVTSVQVFISHLFTERQGTAVGLGLVGNSLAGLLLPLWLAPTLEEHAWDDVMAVLGAASLFVVLLGSFVLLKRPAAYSPMKQGGKPVSGTGNRDFWTDRNFWLVAVSLFLVAAVDGGLIQHTVLYLQVDQAIHYSIVGIAISSYHLASMVSRVLFGRFLDRFSIDGVLVAYALISLSALLAFGVNGAATAILFALVRGLAHGGLIVSIPVLARHRFGHEGLGTIIGVLIALTTTGLAAGNIVLARLYTVTESYALGLIVFCLIPVAAALFLIPIRPRQRDREALPVRD